MSVGRDSACERRVHTHSPLPVSPLTAHWNKSSLHRGLGAVRHTEGKERQKWYRGSSGCAGPCCPSRRLRGRRRACPGVGHRSGTESGPSLRTCRCAPRPAFSGGGARNPKSEKEAEPAKVLAVCDDNIRPTSGDVNLSQLGGARL